MPQHLKSNRQATRIPQSSRHKCLRSSSRAGRPYEYLKAPARMPLPDLSSRQATRIPKSSRHKRLSTPSRTGRPYEYLKAPGTNASAPQVEPAGHTNTSKLPAQMPQKHKSSRQAPRIPQSSRHKRLRTPSRTGRPYEYPKAPGTNASAPQVEPACHTNTQKLPAKMPQHLTSQRQAIRIP